MRYVITMMLIIPLIYIFSFAWYNWTTNNRLAAVGSAIIGFSAVALPIYIMFFGNFEL